MCASTVLILAILNLLLFDVRVYVHLQCQVCKAVFHAECKTTLVSCPRCCRRKKLIQSVWLLPNKDDLCDVVLIEEFNYGYHLYDIELLSVSAHTNQFKIGLKINELLGWLFFYSTHCQRRIKAMLYDSVEFDTRGWKVIADRGHEIYNVLMFEWI